MSAACSRDELERAERAGLAAYATKSADSRGRLVDEPEHPLRTAFQRDRDRIVHSTAFRRLQYKTQVFVYHEGDHYRNRLTHSLEGAQISRTIARSLRLNEDLAEAIALAHDLGHTPFGHAGERVLARLLADQGGFDHNRQCLRVVDLLEQRYPGFPGLNLTEETREGILKHGCDWKHPAPLPELLQHRSLEGQIADAADEIAYTSHDLEDALRSGVMGFEMVTELPLAGAIDREQRAQLASAPVSVRRAQLVMALINQLVTDLVEASAARLEAHRPDSADAARSCETRLVGFSDRVERSKRELKAFLYDNFYNHPRVVRMTNKAQDVVEDLYRVLSEDPRLLPANVQGRFGLEGSARAVADYVAGMTDRFAMSEHRKLLDPHENIGL